VAIKNSLWEILLPFIIVFLYFKGITTLVETSAVTVLYVLLVEFVFYRDFTYKNLQAALLKSLPIMGGVLVILAVAMGLSYYIVDAEIPMQLTAWLQKYIHSKYLFLFLLNIALLVAGGIMDIYGSIIVLVPLLAPLGIAYGINPVHLGIIFLANMELGYLFPPTGINLLLSSYRFNEPLIRIYRYIVPFLIVMFISVLLITYVPWFSTILLKFIQ
jgi:tripartite ATP-independent transporter DctM subunit